MCRCGQGTILTGTQREYNAKSKKDNAHICPDCALEEMYEGITKSNGILPHTGICDLEVRIQEQNNI